jgi:predicted DCC family thiol-disulfide oxidoreductase YuxK
MTNSNLGEDLPEHTVIFDDNCGFCKDVKNLIVRYVDKNSKLNWVPFSSNAAIQILNTFDDDRYESMIYVNEKHELLRYQDAILAIIKLNKMLAKTAVFFEKSKFLNKSLKKVYIWISHHRSFMAKLIPNRLKVTQ